MIKKEQGFTLIELLIVIIILGILAVVGIPKFMNSKGDAETNACATNKATLEDATERYNFDHSGYPDTQALLQTNGYIKKIFNCPTTNTNTYTLDDTTGDVTCSNHP